MLALEPCLVLISLTLDQADSDFLISGRSLFASFALVVVDVVIVDVLSSAPTSRPSLTHDIRDKLFNRDQRESGNVSNLETALGGDRMKNDNIHV